MSHWVEYYEEKPEGIDPFSYQPIARIENGTLPMPAVCTVENKLMIYENILMPVFYRREYVEENWLVVKIEHTLNKKGKWFGLLTQFEEIYRIVVRVEKSDHA